MWPKVRVANSGDRGEGVTVWPHSAMLDLGYVYTVHYGSQQPHVALVLLRCGGVTGELNLWFDVNVRNHRWPASLLPSQRRLALSQHAVGRGLGVPDLEGPTQLPVPLTYTHPGAPQLASGGRGQPARELPAWGWFPPQHCPPESRMGVLGNRSVHHPVFPKSCPGSSF